MRAVKGHAKQRYSSALTTFGTAATQKPHQRLVSCFQEWRTTLLSFLTTRPAHPSISCNRACFRSALPPWTSRSVRPSRPAGLAACSDKSVSPPPTCASARTIPRSDCGAAETEEAFAVERRKRVRKFKAQRRDLRLASGCC